ncbi:MAG TPA: tail fiber domain-containing protein, partial [Thermoanaerobaculia bacterium]
RQLAEARGANDDAAVDRIMTAAGLKTPPYQSGAFSIANGAIISPDLPETGGYHPGASTMATAPKSSTDSRVAPPAKTMDTVIADDEIIQGSLCVGLDCVNNESFGFDTIRLKENNTRIHFDDTSTSPGFPNVNWQLTANDSNSGGANKFSIDDLTNSKTPFTVTAAAPTNSLFIASTGKVGFGNSSPVLNLHITATDTPAIRQEQTNGGGFTAQTWDIGANEANWFVRDVTGGSRLPLRIRPGAPTSSIDIQASGNVGFGTTAPARTIEIDNSVSPALGLRNTGAAADQKYWEFLVFGQTLFGALQNDANTTQNFWLQVNRGTGNTVTSVVFPQGNIGIGVASPTNPIQHSSGALLTSGGVWTNASSRSYKQDITDLDAKVAMDAFAKLEPVTYSYKIDPNEHHVGFIAEDVPNIVATKDRKSLSPMDIVALLTKVVQEQQKTIEDLSARVQQLEKN